jgi:hypothetical protein
VTTDPSAGDQPASDLTKPLRLPAALGMLGVNAVWLLILIQGYLLPSSPAPAFTDRSAQAFAAFTSIAPYPVLLLPLLAVLLATHVRPALEQSATIVKAALGEYAVIALFAVISYLGALFSSPTVRAGFEQFFFRTGMLLILALAAFTVWKVAQPIVQGPPKPDRLAAYGRNSAPPDQQYNPFGQPSGPPAYPQSGAPGVPEYSDPAQPQYGDAAQPQYGQGYPAPPGTVYGGQPAHGEPPPYGEPPAYGDQPSYGQGYADPPAYGEPQPYPPSQQYGAQYQSPQPTVYGTPAAGGPASGAPTSGSAWDSPADGTGSYGVPAQPQWDPLAQPGQPQHGQPPPHHQQYGGQPPYGEQPPAGPNPTAAWPAAQQPYGEPQTEEERERARRQQADQTWFEQR